VVVGCRQALVAARTIRRRGFVEAGAEGFQVAGGGQGLAAGWKVSKQSEAL